MSTRFSALFSGRKKIPRDFRWDFGNIARGKKQEPYERLAHLRESEAGPGIGL